MRTLTIRRGNFDGVAYSEDGHYLVSRNSGRYIRFWDLGDYTLQFVFPLPSRTVINGLLLHGTRLVTRSELLDITPAWQFVRGETTMAPRPAYREIDLEQMPDYPFLDMTPDGRRAAGIFHHYTEPRGAEVRLWDESGKCLRQFRPAGKLYWYWDLALSPDGKVVVLTEGRNVWLLEAEGGAEVARLEVTNSPKRTRFSPDGRLLAVAAGRTVWLWDAATHELRARFPAFLMYVEGLAFSADSRLLGAGSRDGEVRLWDTVSCRQTSCVNWEVGAIHDLAFSPDGMTAAAAGHRNAIVLWDVE